MDNEAITKFHFIVKGSIDDVTDHNDSTRVQPPGHRTLLLDKMGLTHYDLTARFINDLIEIAGRPDVFVHDHTSLHKGRIINATTYRKPRSENYYLSIISTNETQLDQTTIRCLRLWAQAPDVATTAIVIEARRPSTNYIIISMPHSTISDNNAERYALVNRISQMQPRF